MNRHERRAQASQQRRSADNDVDLINKLARTCPQDWLILRYGRSSPLEQIFCTIVRNDNAPPGTTQSCCRAQGASLIAEFRANAKGLRLGHENGLAEGLEQLARDIENALAAVPPGHRLLVHVSGQEVAYLHWPVPN